MNKYIEFYKSLRNQGNSINDSFAMSARYAAFDGSIEDVQILAKVSDDEIYNEFKQMEEINNENNKIA